MMEIAEEDIIKGIECVDYLVESMDLMRSTTDHSLWMFVKEQIRSYVATRGAQVSTEEIRSALIMIGNQLSVELHRRYGYAVAYIFPYTYSISLVLASSVELTTWDKELASIYLQTASCIPPGYFSQKYFQSVERVRPLLVRSLKQSLDASDLKTVCNITTWQSRNFIYHVQPGSLAGTPHSENLQNSVNMHGGHQSRPVVLESSVPVETAILDQYIQEERKMDGGIDETAPEKIGTASLTLVNKSRLEVSDCSDRSAAMASQSSSGLKFHPCIKDSGFIQDELSDSPVAKTLRQQLHHSKSMHSIHLESDVEDLIQDVRERCKQINEDLKDLSDAIVAISDPVVVQTLQEEIEMKQKEMEEENNELLLLTQLKDELKRLNKIQHMPSGMSRLCLLLRPDFVCCQLKTIMDSCCTDQGKLQLLMECGIDVIQAEMLESLTNELASFQYYHPDNIHCQQVLVAALSRRLLVM
jgi:hypothetical protein